MNYIDTVKISFLFLLPIFSGCAQGHPEKIEMEEVESVYFGTLPPNEESIHSLTSFSEVMSSLHYRDTLIKDNSIITEYVQYINGLKPSFRKNRNIDLRIVSVIRLKNGNVRKLGFGYDWYILFDGFLMKDDPEIFSFLNSLLYASRPLDYWLSEEEIKLLDSLL